MANEIYKNKNGKLIVNKDEEISLKQLKVTKERLQARKKQLQDNLARVNLEIENINIVLKQAKDLNIEDKEIVNEILTTPVIPVVEP